MTAPPDSAVFRCRSPQRECSLGHRAFTLVELLVVMGLIVILMALMVPAFNAIQGAGGLTKAAHDIAGLLEQARTHAMAQNTYVFVGFAEVDVSQLASTNPQVPASADTGGRVAVVVFASKDGTRGYSLVDPSSSWASEYSSGGNPGHRLAAISKVHRFENLHLAALRPNPPSGPMHRETVSTGSTFSYMIGDHRAKSVTSIAYPLGSALSDGQYRFEKVIHFDPQGVARIQYASNGDEIKQYIEIGLQPTQGNEIPELPKPNVGEQAAIQLDCMTGSVRIYRP